MADRRVVVAKAARMELLATSRAFDFPADPLPEKVRYVGPQLADPAWTAPSISPWPEDDARPLVAVGFSTTFQNHAGLLQKVIDALEPLPVRVLVTLGGAIREDELRAGAHCVLVDSAPHSVVMAQAAAFVAHGGHGSVIRALAHRLPLLVIPLGRDQNDNAVRVTERSAGLSSIFSWELGSETTSGRGIDFDAGNGSLAWTAGDAVVPEPTGALAAVLMAGGLLRRRR